MNSPEGYNLADFEDDTTIILLESSDSSSSYKSNSLHSSVDSSGITYDASQRDEFNSVIAIDSDDVVENVSENEGNWAELPSLVVEKIYSFLSRTDQGHMSLVCSRWAKEFGSPSLWKTMKFYLYERSSSPEIYPEVRFARKYSSMFHHVEIVCKRIRTNHIGVIWRQLKLFLQAMESSSQLTSIKFIDMGNLYSPLDDILHEDLFKTIISFFNSQENLKTVTFEESLFSKEEGLELLKAVFHSDSNMINNLTLRGFVNEIPSMVISQQYMSNLAEVYCKFANVQSFEVDYTQIFEDLINCLYENLSSGEYQLNKMKPSMTTLNIYCDGRRESLFRGIPPEAWKFLANVFPCLKVKMDVTVHSHLNSEIEKFLVREIPLQSLEFRFVNSSTFATFEIPALVRHLEICNYKDHLEVLNVSF